MEGNNVRSFENLCKIFEMRIKLDREKKVKTPSDVLINYEKYAKKIDNIYNEGSPPESCHYIFPASCEYPLQTPTVLLSLLLHPPERSSAGCADREPCPLLHPAENPPH